MGHSGGKRRHENLGQNTQNKRKKRKRGGEKTSIQAVAGGKESGQARTVGRVITVALRARKGKGKGKKCPGKRTEKGQAFSPGGGANRHRTESQMQKGHHRIRWGHGLSSRKKGAFIDYRVEGEEESWRAHAMASLRNSVAVKREKTPERDVGRLYRNSRPIGGKKVHLASLDRKSTQWKEKMFLRRKRTAI